MKINETDYFHGRKSKPFSVFSIDFYDTLIASGSINGEMKIYGPKQTKTYKDHVGSVLCVRFNKQNLLATCGDDKSVIIYQRDSKKAYNYFKKLQNHFSDVSCLLWTSTSLISCGYDGQIFVHNLTDFAVIKCLKYENLWRGMSIDPQETVIICQSDSEIIAVVFMTIVVTRIMY
ncbi:WD repeat-containing protein 83 [Binucleata daphniae]